MQICFPKFFLATPPGMKFFWPLSPRVIVFFFYIRRYLRSKHFDIVWRVPPPKNQIFLMARARSLVFFLSVDILRDKYFHVVCG